MEEFVTCFAEIVDPRQNNARHDLHELLLIALRSDVWRRGLLGHGAVWEDQSTIAGTERAVVDGAADLQQEIGAAPRPAHLLRFIHPAVHQKIGRSFGDRGANPQAGTVALGIICPARAAAEI
jgi:hypothetical protein